MQTSLRKMGNSTGMIVPRSMLDQLGLTTGTTMTLSIVDGAIVASPAACGVRERWEASAAAIADEATDADWTGFANEDDARLTW